MPPGGAPRTEAPGFGDAEQLLTAFGRHVRDALLHLHDLPYLQTHPLARFVTGLSGTRAANRGRDLQRALLEAIQAMRPEPTSGQRDGRSFQILTLRYAEERSAAEVQENLDVRASEYHRSHRRALDAVVSLLAEQWQIAEPSPPEAWSSPAAEGPPTSLPFVLTSFIGREREIADLSERLRDRAGPRLLTLTGAGGCGKSRLGLEVARAVDSAFPDGVAFVPLGPLRDPDAVIPTIAHGLGLGETSSPPRTERLKTYLRGKELLLVLDNFEHLLDAAPLIGDILTACPRLRVLATSRAPLRVYGEQEYVVPPLPLPAPRLRPTLDDLGRYDAIRLFDERARAVKSAFILTKDNVSAVDAICRRLDGLPLAIELAAAQIRLFSPELIAARLNRRLPLLTDSPRDVPGHQQSLRATIAWSYDLLPAGEQALLQCLAVFPGGFDLEGAEAVQPTGGARGTELLDGIASLVEKSLLRQEAGANVPTFALLETIREFAVEQLEATNPSRGEIWGRAAEYFAQAGDQAAGQFAYPVARMHYSGALEPVMHFGWGER